MAVTHPVQVDVVDEAEGMKILDEAARRYLHIPGEQFLADWQAGKYADTADTPKVMRVAMLIPIALAA